jgi:hypothetical protein
MHHGKGECDGHHGMMMGQMDADCCCHGSRHFLTKKEKIERLEMYQKWLENEAQGVKEAIEELKKA